MSDYSYEYIPPPRRPQTRTSREKRRPREKVVVTETFVGGKLHTRETETFTYKDSGPDTSSDSGASSDQHFSPKRFKERQYSERDRRGPPPFRRDSRRATPRDGMPFRDPPFHRDFKRPRHTSTMPGSDPDIRFEYREPKFHMPPRRDTSPRRRGSPPPRWEDALPRRRAPRPPRWDDPPSFSRPRDHRRQSAPEARDSAPKPTTSPAGHDATAQELLEKVKDKLRPLDEPRWEKASNEALCQVSLFVTYCQLAPKLISM